MTQVPILSGIYTDAVADFRTRYPRNLVPVPKPQGISQGYLRPADGIVQNGTGYGPDRGGINWNGVLYRVSGNKLISQAENGTVTQLGEVGSDGQQATLVYSFDRLAIASAGSLYYWDGLALTRVTDPDLGTCLAVWFVGGYFLSTDGESIISTDLGDPTSVNPLHYGSAEFDPDPVLAGAEMRNESYAFGRHSIEVFRNVGGEGFPFSRIDGASVPKGVIGTHAFCEYLGSFAFVGNGRKEAPAVHLMIPGDTVRLSTREVDTILSGYTEAQLSLLVMETRIDKGHDQLLIHLPDQCLVYDNSASKTTGERVWFTLASSIVGDAAYRARGLVWCYDRWNIGDPTGPMLGVLDNTTMEHFGETVGWDFGTLAMYAEGDSAIIHEIELVGLPGRVDFGDDPVIWTSYSEDGETWSQERAISAGKTGQRLKRLVWLTQGVIRNYRMQKFRGTSDARLSFARMDMRTEQLFVRSSNG